MYPAAHWLSDEERNALRVLQNRPGLFHDMNGDWYHTDESGTEVYGPFRTWDRANQSMEDYGRSL